VLKDRQIHVRRARGVQCTGLDITDHSDDRQPTGVSEQPATRLRLDAMSDRILTWPEPLRQVLVNQDGRRCLLIVSLEKEPSPEKRCPHHPEVVGTHGSKVGDRTPGRLDRPALDRKRRRAAIDIERDRAGNSNRSGRSTSMRFSFSGDTGEIRSKTPASWRRSSSSGTDSPTFVRFRARRLPVT
jgi:hypothetical protein